MIYFCYLDAHNYFFQAKSNKYWFIFGIIMNATRGDRPNLILKIILIYNTLQINRVTEKKR